MIVSTVAPTLSLSRSCPSSATPLRVTFTAVQIVVAGASADRVVAAAAVDGVIAGAAYDDFIARPAGDVVAFGSANDPLDVRLHVVVLVAPAIVGAVAHRDHDLGAA